MKTIKAISKVTMLFAFVAFANTLMGSGNLKVNIRPINSEKAVVAISNAEASNYQISIVNDKGEVVYSKQTDEETMDYNKVFDFSNLENGDYKLVATVNRLTTERAFYVNNKTILVGKEKNMIEPYFTYKNGTLKISYLNFSQEKLNLNFYTENEMVYSDVIGDSFSIQKGYNLSKLEKGSYSVVLSTVDKAYTYNVNVE
jgi:hypothetical protein